MASADDAEQALAELFERHKRRLFAYLYHLLGDQTVSEDLVSETFLRLFRHRRSYRIGAGFVPWLFTIGRNLARDELRRRAVRQRVWQILARQQAPGGDPVRDRSNLVDLQEAVRRALLQLPEDQRTALVLREYHELNYREVGEVLGCSEEAARAKAYRARAALRKLLADGFAE